MNANQTAIDAPTVAIETHGCKLNQADSSVLARDFVRAGFRVVAKDQAADVYLVNSCTVTHVADRKARQALRSARRRNPEATIVATGCYAERDPDSLRALGEVDLVAGNRDKASLVRSLIDSNRVIAGPCTVGAEAPITSPAIARTRAMVKIQEGCDQVCAYCIVPKVRGRERSIPPREILGTIEEHLAQGYKEIVLTGTQLGTYGFDLPDIDLSGLLTSILRETSSPRLRVSSLQPQEIDAGFLSLWSDPRVCPHFHLPLQNGSDAVLKRMRRRYTAEEYKETVDLIRRMVPGASITADVIVGFPGETDSQFRETYRLCEEIGFAAMHVFPYSTRPGTSAAHFRDKVGPQTKSSRMQELLALARSQSEAFRERLVGSVRPVLWEAAKGPTRPDIWVGLTDNYVRVQAQSRRPLGNKLTAARLVGQDGDVVVAEVL